MQVNKHLLIGVCVRDYFLHSFFQCLWCVNEPGVLYTCNYMEMNNNNKF